MPSYTLSPGSPSPAMRIFYLLVSLDLILTASVPYANRPKSCWLELTKEKGDQCFTAEPECSQSCRPGEPVSGILCLFCARVKKWNTLFFCPRKKWNTLFVFLAEKKKWNTLLINLFSQMVPSLDLPPGKVWGRGEERLPNSGERRMQDWECGWTCRQVSFSNWQQILKLSFSLAATRQRR